MGHLANELIVLLRLNMDRNDSFSLRRLAFVKLISGLNLVLSQNSDVTEYSRQSLQSKNMPFFPKVLSKTDSEFELL